MATLRQWGLIAFAKNLFIAFLILIVGLYFIRLLNRFIISRLEKRRVDPSLKSFLIPLIGGSLKVVLFITVIRQLGIEAASFVALITSAGLAVGLALQGSLSNFAGGVLLLLLKPFRVGDYIEVEGFSGTVKNISIFYTEIVSDNGQQVFIPNGDLSNASIMNYSTNPLRRIDLTLSVSYDDDPVKVREVLTELLRRYPALEADPAPSVTLKAYTERSINFSLRAWIKRERYRETLNELLPMIKETFDKENITIPYPKYDVYLHDQTKQDIKSDIKSKSISKQGNKDE